ncbi:hypothetical protein Halru_2599 [Halovivax ruber XH-70]|uniref:Solute:sodium symporter small subunit n=1 Tax=Halovivax ruber (strain DSM 18193 / JCM 13892 / XH-70) TaxID=797302 RepID=L0IC78_HALRX|nr:hypothetical protein [Halovivax ruber]AGB17180.1 hypothetical protein Halru_2599 [Halovivax ruber XH-70]
MTDQSSIPDSLPVQAYIEDGARLAAILLVWGIISAFFTYGLTELGIFEQLWFQLGELFALVGVLNATLYLGYRVVDYWRATA